MRLKPLTARTAIQLLSVQTKNEIKQRSKQHHRPLYTCYIVFNCEWFSVFPLYFHNDTHTHNTQVVWMRVCVCERERIKTIIMIHMIHDGHEIREICLMLAPHLSVCLSRKIITTIFRTFWLSFAPFQVQWWCISEFGWKTTKRRWMSVMLTSSMWATMQEIDVCTLNTHSLF